MPARGGILEKVENYHLICIFPLLFVLVGRNWRGGWELRAHPHLPGVQSDGTQPEQLAAD